jgi:hypothetical protein
MTSNHLLLYRLTELMLEQEQHNLPVDLLFDDEQIGDVKWAGKDKSFCIDHQNAFDIKKKKTANCQETVVFTKNLLSQTYNTIDIQ